MRKHMDLIIYAKYLLERNISESSISENENMSFQANIMRSVLAYGIKILPRKNTRFISGLSVMVTSSPGSTP